MARITLESIAQELSVDGWKVTSEEYVNLKTEMEFTCAEGHKVFSTWEKIRQKRLCPVCEQNQLKNPKSIIKPKTKVDRILALDQASNITGWSVFDGKELIQYGVYKTKSKEEFDRFHEVGEWLISMIQNWQPDLVGLEGIQFQQNMGVTTFQTLARLQGILGDICMRQKVKFQICPTNTWRNHCGVKGRARADRKKSMQLLAKEWYDISISEDEADAIGIGKYIADNHSQQIEIINWE